MKRKVDEDIQGKERKRERNQKQRMQRETVIKRENFQNERSREQKCETEKEKARKVLKKWAGERADRRERERE
eukprot:883484-Amorphochlora_amoeboformis.AAC.1